jgi:glycosyltransferase involved in cell wall biosynthesis
MVRFGMEKKELVNKKNSLPLKSLGVFVPVYNEEENIEELFRQLGELRSNISSIGIELRLLIHDNQSTDNSWVLIKKYIQEFPNSTAIRMTHNIGYQQSLTVSFSNLNTDAYVVYQSDLQDPISVILKMSDLWLQGKLCVLAVPINRAETFLERLGRRIFVLLFKASSEFENFKWFTDFYLLDRVLYKRFSGLPLNYQFIRGRILETFPVSTVIEYQRLKRAKGESKFSFAKKYSLAVDAILLHASRGIRVLTILGAVTASMLIFVSIIDVLKNLITLNFNDLFVEFLNGISLLLLSICLLTLSLALEYLRRLYDLNLSSKHSPPANYDLLYAEVVLS